MTDFDRRRLVLAGASVLLGTRSAIRDRAERIELQLSRYRRRRERRAKRTTLHDKQPVYYQWLGDLFGVQKKA